MITIFKNKKDIPQNQECIELNDLFFNQNTVTLLDEKAAPIIEKIDHAKLLGKYKIRSKFEDVSLNIDQLSTGCKTVLNVLYYPQKVFCIKECGDNALELLYNMEQGNVYSDYAMIPFDMKQAAVQNKNGRQEISDYEELKEWWNNEE